MVTPGRLGMHRLGRVPLNLIAASSLIAGGLAWPRLRTEPAEGPTPPKALGPFSLRDADGRTHGREEWRGTRGVLLVAVRPGSKASGAEVGLAAIRDLGRRAAAGGLRVYGLDPDPADAAESVRRWARGAGIDAPILLDPTQDLTSDCEVRSTPTALLIGPDGHVLYRGSLVDRAGVASAGAALSRIIGGAADLGPAAPVVAGEPIPPARSHLDPDRPVTYHADVAPILREHCVSCHRPGMVGPFSLLTYADAARRSGFLRDVTQGRQMPPWRAEPGYGEFLDQHRLDARELETIAAWADSGAPEGAAGGVVEAPARADDGWHLGTPDVVLTMTEPFSIAADAADVYRCFVLPVPPGPDLFVSAVEFRPDNGRVVHHARLYLDEAREHRSLDAADATPGFEAFAGGGILKPGLGAWTPGSVARRMPEGVGRVVKGGSDVLLMIHYHGTGKPEVDRSRVGLILSPTRPREWPTNVPLATDKIDIPPGAARHRVHQVSTLPADVVAYSILPHGHYLLREIRLVATYPDGRVRGLLWIKDWDFNWQGQYHFRTPISLPKGTRLDADAVYDNSEANPHNPHHPPARVRYGYASADEMFGCHLQVLGADEEARGTLRRKWPNGL